MNEQDQLIADQLKTLPPELQQAIQAVPWKSLVQEIAKANSLTPDQTVSFDQETMLTIYGFENPNNYISNLTRELGVTQDVANNIANAVAEKILNPINEKASGAGSNIPEIAPEIHPVIGGGAFIPPKTDEPLKTQLSSIPTQTSGPVMILKKGDGKQMMSTPTTQTPPTNPVKPSVVTENKVSLPDYRYDGHDPYREPLK